MKSSEQQGCRTYTVYGASHGASHAYIIPAPGPYRRLCIQEKTSRRQRHISQRPPQVPYIRAFQHGQSLPTNKTTIEILLLVSQRIQTKKQTYIHPRTQETNLFSRNSNGQTEIRQANVSTWIQQNILRLQVAIGKVWVSTFLQVL